MTSNVTTAQRFLAAFCAQDTAALRELLSEDFVLEGPLFSFDNREDYLRTLELDAPEARSFDPIEILEGSDSVAVFYRFSRPGLTLNMAQLFRFRGAQIVSTLILFDGREFDHVHPE